MLFMVLMMGSLSVWTFSLLCSFSLCFSGLIKGAGVLPNDSLNASVGTSVTFSTTLTAQEGEFILIDWKFKDSTIIYFNEEINITSGYEGRVNISMNTGSLELRNLAVNDSGQYRVIIFQRRQNSQEGATILNVYGELTMNLLGQTLFLGERSSQKHFE